MSFDPAATAGLMVREVRNGSRDGAPTKIAIARRAYSASQADLWDALTNPERIPRWFLPVSGELRVGGRYQLQGNAGGVVESCSEPESFAVTWEFGEMMSWLRVRLTPDGERTMLELAHEAHVDPGMWGQFGPGAVGVGWDLALLMGLDRHLETGAQADRGAAAAFPGTPEGAEFIRLCAAGWGSAAIAAGDEPGAAREAAARTAAFYAPRSEDTPGHEGGAAQPEGGAPESGG